MRFNLKVYSESAGVSDWQADAESAEDASRQAGAQGYVVLSVSASSPFAARATWMKLGRRARFPLLQFSQQLLALLEAGLNLVEAIEALADKEPNADVQGVLRRLLDGLRSGLACSDAMAAQSENFPSLYVAMLRASEGSGGMIESLRRYVAYQTQLDAVKKKATSALIYPVLLLVVGGLVTVFLLGYVVPKFSRIYEERATDLPFLSQVLMQWGSLASHHGGELLAALVLAIPACAWVGIHPRVRLWVGSRLWAAPWLGERLRVYQLARLYRTLGMLLRSGTPVVGALDLVPGLLGPVLRGGLAVAASLIREGQGIPVAFFSAGLTTPVAHRMLQVGERGGRMGEMMERIAAFYDDDIARSLDVFARVFEPALMALIGFMVGGIVILMYLPIFELAGSIQK